MGPGLELIEFGAEAFGVDGEGTGWGWSGREGLGEEVVVCLGFGRLA